MLISSINDLIALWPSDSLKEGPRALEGPCPYCSPSGADTVRINADGHKFVGDDRFKIWLQGFGNMWCQRCDKSVRLDQLVHDISPGALIATSFDTSAIEETKLKRVDRPALDLFLVDDSEVSARHAQVDRSFWKRFGWTDATIDALKLGLGPVWLAGIGETAYRRHLFPLQIAKAETLFNGWIFEGRIDTKIPGNEHRPKVVKPKATDAGFYGLRIDDPDDPRLAVMEGSKDAGTAYQLGFKNFLVVFGTKKWDGSFLEIAKDRFEKLVIFGDNDDAGREFNETVSHSAHLVGLKPLQLVWSLDKPSGYDLTNLLEELGTDGARLFVERNLKTGRPSRGYIKNFWTVDEKYDPPKSKNAKSIEVVRQELPEALEDFIANYSLYKKNGGAVQVLASPPGSGKSFALVQFAQELADRFEAEEPDAENKAKILFASPFVHAWDDVTGQPCFKPEYWYNFESRNENNCANFQKANEIGKRGYSVMSFCNLICPFASKCVDAGYLHQEIERRKRPITFVRHQNLMSDSMLDGYKVIIIDENPMGALSGFAIVRNERDLAPSDVTWRERLLDDSKADLVNIFIAGLRKVMVETEHTSEQLSGLTFMSALERQVGMPLSSMVAEIGHDLIDKYQPHHVSATVDDYSKLPNRVVPKIFEAVVDEIEDYEKGIPYNTRLWCLKGKLEVSTLQQFVLPKKHPIIVADGTATPEFYQYFFGREVKTYAPDLYNPAAQITQLYGSDFTLSSLRSATANATQLIDQIDVADVFGDVINLEEAIEYTEKPFSSPALERLFLTLKKIGSDPYHRQVLVVSRKKYLDFIVPYIKKLAKKEAAYAGILTKAEFVHYGSLRGSNKYKDYDTVVLIGCPRVNYDLLHRQAQAWARLAKHPTYIGNEIVVTSSPYHSEYDVCGFGHPGFSDPFAQMLVDDVEIGEIRQCLDRARVYAGGTKYAYLMMNRPAARWITNFKSIRFFTDDAFAEVKSRAEEYLSLYNRLPTITELSEICQVPRYKAAKVLQELSAPL